MGNIGYQKVEWSTCTSPFALRKDEHSHECIAMLCALWEISVCSSSLSLEFNYGNLAIIRLQFICTIRHLIHDIQARLYRITTT